MMSLKDLINLDGREEINSEAVARDMMNYLDMLLKLEQNGFQCKREINVALKVLHKSLGFIDEKEEININTKRAELLNRFKDGLKNNRLVLVGKSERGMGKTTILINHALAEGHTIVVKTEELIRYVKLLDKDVKVITSTELIRSRALTQYRGLRLLIDCNVPMEDILKIRDDMNFHIVGGFHHNDFLI